MTDYDYTVSVRKPPDIDTPNQQLEEIMDTNEISIIIMVLRDHLKKDEDVMIRCNHG